MNLLHCTSTLQFVILYIWCCIVVEDYTAIAGETVTFAPGETCVSVVVSVTDDEVHEKNETFVGSLKTSNLTPDNVFTGDPSMSVGTIIDDDDLSKNTAVSYNINKQKFLRVELFSCIEHVLTVY